jgi:hypothetical protein
LWLVSGLQDQQWLHMLMVVDTNCGPTAAADSNSTTALLTALHVGFFKARTRLHVQLLYSCMARQGCSRLLWMGSARTHCPLAPTTMIAHNYHTTAHSNTLPNTSTSTNSSSDGSSSSSSNQQHSHYHRSHPLNSSRSMLY